MPILDTATVQHSPGTNLMEATAPADRPTDAVSQLRDIGEWLRGQGHRDLAGDADDLADYIAERFPEAGR